MENLQKIGDIFGDLRFFGDLILRSKFETQFEWGEFFGDLIWGSKWETQFRVGLIFGQLIVAIKIYKPISEHFSLVFCDWFLFLLLVNRATY